MRSVCAVIVTYNPSPELTGNVEAVACQVKHVVVVDNGSTGETEQSLQELELRPDCTVIRNCQNLGIAAALNIGMKCAMEAGADWIATFDQDSRVSNGFISQMLGAYQKTPQPERIAIIAPQYVDRESGVVSGLMRSRNGEILTTMTSGSMMPSSAIRLAGSFDESLYMDYVDIELCLRVRRKRMLILQSQAILYHSLGRTTYHRWLGLSFKATNHSAARRYYITRNRLRLLMHYVLDWSWVWRETRAFIFESIKILLVEDNRWRKFRAMMTGTLDALRAKAGKQVEL